MAMKYLYVDFCRVYANSSSEDGKKQNQSVHTHTAFLTIFRVVHETKDKNALEIRYQHFKRSPKFSILPIIYEIFDQMACLTINLVRRWLTSNTKKNFSKTFLKNN